MSFVVKEKKKAKKMITGISGFDFLLAKNGRFVTQNCSPKQRVAETPIFIVLFGCALFGQVVKKGNFGHPPKKRKKWLITEKLFFWYFCVFVFFVFVFFFFLFCYSCAFFGGFKGQVRWPEGPPHLALNPPYLFFVSSFFLLGFFVLEGLRVRWGGPKGHLTWH